MSRVKTARRKAQRAQKRAGRVGHRAQKTATQTVAPRLETARDQAVSYAGEAAEWVQPHYAHARERVKDDVVPRVSQAVNRGLVASEPVREEALSRGTAAIAALRGDLEPPKPRRRWGRRLLLVVGLAGAAAGAKAAWSRMSVERAPSTFEDERSLLAGSEPATTSAVNGSTATSETSGSEEPVAAEGGEKEGKSSSRSSGKSRKS